MRKYFITIIGIVLLGYSCTTDYLDITPESSLTSGDFYQTDDDFDMAIAACYSGLQDYYISNLYLESIVEGRTDDITANNYWTLEYGRFLDDASSEGVDWIWSSLFKIISNCNAIVTNIDNLSDDASNKERVLGEAYFIRGLCYFQLVKFFGGVPLYDGTKTQDEYYIIPRSSEEETYNFIYSDFNLAINNLSESYTDDDIGRATSWAAKGFLAKAYLYNEDYSSSLELLEEIIDSGEFEFFEDWSQIFNEDNDNGKQALFQIQFTSGGIGEGNAYQTYCREHNAIIINGRTMEYNGSSRSQSALVSEDLINSFDTINDARFDLSIAVYNTQQDGSIQYWPQIWKFTAGAYDPTSQYDWGLNYTLLRYTDILLMKAECINELNGPTAEAVEIINRIRNRANLPDLTDTDTADKTSFFNALVEERRHELCFEGHRWFDLIRWGIAENVINAYLDVLYPDYSSWRMESYHELFPIPYEQIEIIGDESVLWQNSGW